jgi:uncharacterized protein (DUF2141 family)
MPHYQRFALIILGLVFINSCARVVNPTGGDKDITPPVLVKSIPANNSTNFSSSTLVLSFDEYISLDNPSQNIIVAPLPKNKVNYKIKGKDIWVEFDETLLANTTYSIFFGDAIKDVNEANILSNFSFVFSTGNELDSLEISGLVKFANTDKPAEKIKVLAYENLSDSAVTTSKPIYVSVTNAAGKYTFKNLPNRPFRIFALEDKNGNFKKDLPNETFDFSSNSILSLDSLPNETLRIFESEIDLKKKKHTFYKNNVIAVAFNQNGEGSEKHFYTNKGENIKVVAGENNSDSIVLMLNEPLPDTIINPITGDSITVSFSDRNKDYSAPWLMQGNRVLWDSVLITSALPFAPTDTFSICGIKDSTNYCVDQTLGVKILDNKRLFVLPSFLDSIEKAGKLWVSAGSLSSLPPFENNTNDSLYFSLQKPDSSSFGVLTVTIKNTEYLEGFIVLKKDKQEIMRLDANSESELLLKSPLLSAGAYNLLFVQDDNGDGKWTPGKYAKSEKLKAERTIAFKEEIKIRSNWELDLEWNLTLSEE